MCLIVIISLFIEIKELLLVFNLLTGDQFLWCVCSQSVFRCTLGKQAVKLGTRAGNYIV